MLKQIEEYIEELGGYEEWEKKCLAEEKKYLKSLTKANELLPHNNPTIITDEMDKDAVVKLLQDVISQYRQFFWTRNPISLLTFHQKLVTFIQLSLLEDVESETEPTEDIIFRALKKYVEMRSEE